MAGQRNILFTATFHSSFIDQDLHTLQKLFHVSPVVSSGLPAFLQYVRRIASHDITYSWFASVYSSFLVYLAAARGKKSILVLGGVDVASEKELRYGIWNSWWKAKIVRYGMTHASAVLAVDDFLRREAIRLARYDGANIAVVPTGYDPEFWVASGTKENVVLTVSACPDMTRAKVKGVDVFFSVARKAPDIRFQIIGIDPRIAAALAAPPNVTCLPFSDRSTVLSAYQRAKVYCQLSLREGLPNALCEAMLCECVPVGTNVGGIPTAIGESGYLVEYRDEEQTEIAIRAALTAAGERGKLARRRIATRFTIAQRETALKDIIEKLLQ